MGVETFPVRLLALLSLTLAGCEVHTQYWDRPHPATGYHVYRGGGVTSREWDNGRKNVSWITVP